MRIVARGRLCSPDRDAGSRRGAGERRSREQAAASDGRHHAIELGGVLQQLESGRALSREHVPVVEGMGSAATPARQLVPGRSVRGSRRSRRRARPRRDSPGWPRSSRGSSRSASRRGSGRQPRGRARHGLRVVALEMQTMPRCPVEARHGVRLTAELEAAACAVGTRAEPDLRRHARRARRREHRRAPDVSLDTRARAGEIGTVSQGRGAVRGSSRSAGAVEPVWSW